MKKRILKYYPEEIYSILIDKLKQDAEAHLKQIITDVVVTVPAFFNRAQIYSTIKGCTLDRMRVLRTIKESQSIALGIYNKNENNTEKNVLIYNMGGGTIDVAVILIQDQIFEVKSVNGDTHLGGEDFLQRIINYCQEEFKV